MVSSQQIDTLGSELRSIEREFDHLEETQKRYLAQLALVEDIQKNQLKQLKDYQKNYRDLKESLKRVKLDEIEDEAEKERFKELLGGMDDKKLSVRPMLDELPRESNGAYLNVILGRVNISILKKEDRFRYKDEYEKFKLTINIISFFCATVAYILQLRVVDAIFHFLLVWYYCTLTIRESILRVNGSRIKGWWVMHHYISTLLCGILLTWPDGECYQLFRNQFLVFSSYLSVVQWMQCQYQRGILYKLRTLGQSHDMDVTVDGFQTWMFKGLSFILPFLAIAYLFQLYNACTLIFIYFRYSCADWQVLAMGILFLVLMIGNSLTTTRVIIRKYGERIMKAGSKRRLISKYSSADLESAAKQE